MLGRFGSVSEWPKEAVCKIAGAAYDGSNPSRPTAVKALVRWHAPRPGPFFLPRLMLTPVGDHFPEGPLTIVFSDVEGSTDLRTQRGDTVAHRILRAHEEIVRRCLAEHSGREVKALGDGFMIAFSSARKALSCGRAIQDALAAHNRRAPGDEVHVRIGINTGEVVVEGDDLYGQAVNAAARIAARARGGEVLVSEVVRHLVGSGPEFTFVDRGRFRLKGFPDRWHLYALFSAAGDAPADSGAGRTRFVGRAAESAELARLLDRAVAGEGSLVFLGGEPGVGKTRLSEELLRRAEGRCHTRIGHSYESGRDLPYMPWVEIFESAMAESTPEELRQALGDEASEIARLVPELRRLLPGMAPSLEMPAEQQRRYTFNSIRDYVTRTSQTWPRLYVLEDLHWADEPTLGLLEHLTERLATIPCLIVATCRNSPADITPQLRETLSRLVRRPHVRRMDLARHSEEDVGVLLRALAGSDAPERVCSAVFAETEGNVFFIEEVFRHFHEAGRLLDERGRFRHDIAIGELEVPPNVALVTGQRLDRLSEVTQQVLGIAAVAGRHVGFGLLEAVTDVTADELIDALEEAERSGVVVTDSLGPDEEYWFAHELTRQTVLTRLPAARRRRHHLTVAEALERLHAGDLSAQAATIAQHLTGAGSSADPGELFRFLVMAGQRSLESAAFEDALRHLRRAAELADHGTPAEQAGMLVHLGMAERSLGNWGGAVIPWRRAIDLFEGLGDVDAVGRVCLTAGFNLAWAARFEEAYELIGRGLTALSDRRTPDRARLLSSSAFFVGAAGFYDDAMVQIDEGLALADELGNSDALASGLLWKAILHVCFMEWQTAADDCRRVEEIYHRSGELWHLATARGFLLESLVGLGQFDAARQLHDELVPFVERLGNAGAMWHCIMANGQLAFANGDLPALEMVAKSEIEHCEQTGLGWASWGWAWLAEVELLFGNLDAAIAHSEQAQALAAPGPFRGLEWPPQFEALAAAGRREEALALLEAARPELPRLGAPAGLGPWLMLLSAVEGLVMLGEREEAAALYPLVAHCIEWTRTVGAYPVDAKLVERVAGLAAAAGAQWKRAEDHYRAALEQSEALPHRPEQARTRRCYAALLLERDGPGDHDRATQLLAEAEALYHDMGLRYQADLVRALPR